LEKYGAIKLPTKSAWGKSEHHQNYWECAQKDWPAKSHPSYVNVTIEGITEIVEHRKIESIFYISNEDAVNKAIGHIQ